MPEGVKKLVNVCGRCWQLMEQNSNQCCKGYLMLFSSLFTLQSRNCYINRNFAFVTLCSPFCLLALLTYLSTCFLLDQVVALVCAHAVDGNVREALNLIDQPINKMVFTTEVPPGVRDFVERQYSTTDSLMDLDPGLMVSIIDAVRYK